MQSLDQPQFEDSPERARAGTDSSNPPPSNFPWELKADHWGQKNENEDGWSGRWGLSVEPDERACYNGMASKMWGRSTKICIS